MIQEGSASLVAVNAVENLAPISQPQAANYFQEIQAFFCQFHRSNNGGLYESYAVFGAHRPAWLLKLMLCACLFI